MRPPPCWPRPLPPQTQIFGLKRLWRCHWSEEMAGGIPILLDLIQEKNHVARLRALEALSRCGEAKEVVIPGLVRVLWDDGPARAKAAEGSRPDWSTGRPELLRR